MTDERCKQIMGQQGNIAYVLCLICRHKWLALYHPETIDVLECPKCGAQNSNKDYVEH